MNTTRLNRLLYRIGGFGAWQRIQFLILTPSLLFVCWSALLCVFLFEEGGGTVPNDPDGNSTEPYTNHSAEPWLLSNDSTISWYETDQRLASIEPQDGCSTHFIQSMHTEYGHHNRSVVCARAWLRSAFNGFFALGSGMGIVLFYLLSKRFGRKPVVVVCTILYIICGIISPFLQLHVLLMIFRFFTGLFASGIKTAALLISLEIISSVYHWQVILLWAFAHGVGYILVTAIWALFSHWQASLLVSYLLCIALLLYVSQLYLPQASVHHVYRGESGVLIPPTFHILAG
ncbi:unnamed protein product [Soboliphyme baturini]|uniref:MFS domain-containing protein n=1 Tax=Soboliphyme baturini TaxID=241478 RepID=A0A183IYR1_9BILA|nr:unnamed protein product [Soboliphyme baturini]